MQTLPPGLQDSVNKARTITRALDILCATVSLRNHADTRRLGVLRGYIVDGGRLTSRWLSHTVARRPVCTIIGRTKGPTMFERYTEKARRAIFFARYEASTPLQENIK